MMMSSALVLLMVPGIALFYSGVSNSHFALSQAWLPIMTTAVVGLEASYQRKDQAPQPILTTMASGIFGAIQSPSQTRLPPALSGEAQTASLSTMCFFVQYAPMGICRPKVP
jgi:ammonia channel protein AmtB